VYDELKIKWSKAYEAQLKLVDDKSFRFYSDLENAIKGEVPSLKECSSLTVKGDVVFGDGVIFKGDVSISNENSETLFIENQILGEING